MRSQRLPTNTPPLSFSPSLWGDAAIDMTYLQRCLVVFAWLCRKKKKKLSVQNIFLLTGKDWAQTNFCREETNSVLEEKTSQYLEPMPQCSTTSILSSFPTSRMQRCDETIVWPSWKRPWEVVRIPSKILKRTWDHVSFSLGVYTL